jgi:glutathione S-transferase
MKRPEGYPNQDGVDREMGIEPVVYGEPYSVYVRVVRLALEEKGVPYRLVPIDVFTPDGPPKEYLVRQPFGRIPAFEHGEFQLYEAGAITRYVDEAFPGPALQATTSELRARTHQVISILDSYAYRTLIWDIYVERVSVPKRGGVPDEQKIRDAIPRAVTCLSALQQIMLAGPFLTGPALTLADLHAAPMFAYFTMAPEAHQLLALYPSLTEWWYRMAMRRSMTSTVYP